MQRHKARLGREAKQGEGECEAQHLVRAARQMGDDFAVFGEIAADHEEADDHEVGRAAAEHHVLDGRFTGLGGTFPRHQCEGRPRHDFPLRGKGADVVRGHDVEQRAEGQEQEEPVPVLAAVLFDVVGRVTGHERADAGDDQGEEAGERRQITDADEREGDGKEAEGVACPVRGLDDARAEDEEGAHIEEQRRDVPRAFQFHQRVRIDADDPRAEILHQKTAEAEEDEQGEQDVDADGGRGGAPAVGDVGAPTAVGHAHQFGFPVEKGAGEAAATERDVGTDGLVRPREADLQHHFGGEPQEHRVSGGHDQGEDRAAEGHVDAVHGHGVQDQMLTFRRHGRGNAQRGLKREGQQHRAHGVSVQRAAYVVGHA